MEASLERVRKLQQVPFQLLHDQILDVDIYLHM